MAKRVNSYFTGNKKKDLVDIDFHDFMEMVDRGYNNEEIASELGVSKEQVFKLKSELNK